jgi:hypothetical protein
MTARSWLAPLAITLLIVGVIALNQVYKPRPPTALTLNCPDLRAGCRADLGALTAVIGIDGELRLMRPFELWVRAEGVTKARASFTMEGMDMGFNLYTLRADGKGAYRARITLPICVTGRRDWLLRLDLDGRHLVVPFVTEM